MDSTSEISEPLQVSMIAFAVENLEFDLTADVAAFTDIAIANELSEHELDRQAQQVMVRHHLNQNQMILEVYGRLLMLARFCQCRPCCGVDAATEESAI